MAKKKSKIMPIDLEEMVTLPAASQLMDCAESYVRKLVRDGRLDGLKFGRNYLISKQAALAFRKIPGRGRPKIKKS